MAEGESGIKIHLFDNWYIGNNSYEYHIYQPKEIDGKKGKLVLGHYSTIPGLLTGITNMILKRRSSAKTFKELEANLEAIKGLIESIQQIAQKGGFESTKPEVDTKAPEVKEGAQNEG